MAYGVVYDHMGNLEWSDTFDKLSDAVQCYESWLQRYGSNPERDKEKISSYFEYGAHGARVSVVMEVRLLREKITHAQARRRDVRHLGPHRANQAPKHNQQQPKQAQHLQPTKRKVETAADASKATKATKAPKAPTAAKHQKRNSNK